MYTIAPGLDSEAVKNLIIISIAQSAIMGFAQVNHVDLTTEGEGNCLGCLVSESYQLSADESLAIVASPWHLLGLLVSINMLPVLDSLKGPQDYLDEPYPPTEWVEQSNALDAVYLYVRKCIYLYAQSRQV